MDAAEPEQGPEFLNGEDAGDPPLWAPAPQAERGPGHQSLTPSPFGVFTPDAWLKGPRKGKWLLLLLIFVMGAGCNNRGWRGKGRPRSRIPTRCSVARGGAVLMGPRRRAGEAVAEMEQVPACLGGCRLCLSVHAVSHSLFMALMVPSARVSASALCLSVPRGFPSVWPEFHVAPLPSWLSPLGTV